MKTYSFIVLSIFLLHSCEVKRETLETAIQGNIIKFEDSNLPTLFTRIVKSKSIVLLGETHYLQEHAEFLFQFVSDELESGHEFALLNEQPRCFNWLIEDYIKGDIDSLPLALKYFDGFLLDSLRYLSITKSPKLNFQYSYMDVNHGMSFLSSLHESEAILGEQLEFASVKGALFDSQEYKKALLKLHEDMKKSPTRFKEKWGEKWYYRYFDMLESELISFAYRSSSDRALRERAMYDFIIAQRGVSDANLLLVNCGMYHAQKKSQMGGRRKRIGSWLDESYRNELYSIAFIGIEGETKMGHWYNPISNFDLTKSSPKNDLISNIGLDQSQAISFLEFTDPTFGKTMSVSYHPGESYSVRPSEQFDAVITYPKVSILNSMKNMDFDGY